MDARQAEKQLAQLFRRRGYVRIPSDDRRVDAGAGYHKGWEVRLVVENQRALRDVRSWLKAAGFSPASAFGKHSRYVQPVYGREAVERFLAWNDPPMSLGQRSRRRSPAKRRSAASR